MRTTPSHLPHLPHHLQTGAIALSENVPISLIEETNIPCLQQVEMTDHLTTTVATSASVTPVTPPNTLLSTPLCSKLTLFTHPTSFSTLAAHSGVTVSTAEDTRPDTTAALEEFRPSIQPAFGVGSTESTSNPPDGAFIHAVP